VDGAKSKPESGFNATTLLKSPLGSLTVHQKGDESMVCVHYLSEHERIEINKKLRPIIDDMAQNQIYMALLYVLDGMEIKEAIDLANLIPKMRYR